MEENDAGRLEYLIHLLASCRLDSKKSSERKEYLEEALGLIEEKGLSVVGAVSGEIHPFSYDDFVPVSVG